MGCDVSLSEHKTAAISRPRIENLSDLVFGLALSISALSLLSKPPTTPAEFQGDLLTFAFSFLILISVWASYTRVMSVLPIETGTTIVLNYLMLLLVALEPYLLYLVNQFGDITQNQLVNDASMVYALDMGGLMAILAFFHHALSVEERGLIPQQLMGQHKHARNMFFISAGLFFLTILPQFWSWHIGNMPMRFYLWFVPLIIAYISRGVSARRGSVRDALPNDRSSRGR